MPRRRLRLNISLVERIKMGARQGLEQVAGKKAAEARKEEGKK